MEVITRQEFTERLVQLCVSSGLRGIPRKIRDRHILLKSITLTLELKSEYAEHELNDELRSWLSEVGKTIRRVDHVNLRRLLVDQEYVGRSRDGSRYWVAVGSRYREDSTLKIFGSLSESSSRVEPATLGANLRGAGACRHAQGL